MRWPPWWQARAERRQARDDRHLGAASPGVERAFCAAFGAARLRNGRPGTAVRYAGYPPRRRLVALLNRRCTTQYAASAKANNELVKAVVGEVVAGCGIVERDAELPGERSETNREPAMPNRAPAPIRSAPDSRSRCLTCLGRRRQEPALRFVLRRRIVPRAGRIPTHVGLAHRMVVRR